jgi:ribonuclease Z
MRPLLHPILINGRFGDPTLYVETLFEKHALLFDIGDISALPPRKIQRIDRIFVSHAHIDHFIGFDRLLRVLVGRDKTVHLYGPPGFIDRVYHKLQGYHWNLVGRYVADVVFDVSEIDPQHAMRTTRFRFKRAFAGEEMDSGRAVDGILHSEPAYRVKVAMFEHRTPCLGFALEETAHVNIWKSRLVERGFPVGPWLRRLKRAVMESRPDDFVVSVGETRSAAGRQVPLGDLRDVLTVTPGQKIAYVTDVADTPGNGEKIVQLVRGADLLFIEAAFAEADAGLAAERAHLTTAAAGRLARAAGVRRIEPFHYSPRYQDQEEQMLREVMAAFAGEATGTNSGLVS